MQQAIQMQTQNIVHFIGSDAPKIILPAKSTGNRHFLKDVVKRFQELNAGISNRIQFQMQRDIIEKCEEKTEILVLLP